MSSCPYSSERPVDPGCFGGYQRSQGSWTPREIADWLRSAEGGPPSFWIVGERKLGKTSYLRLMEHLLLRGGDPRIGCRPVVPLYVCCKRPSSLADFYRALIERFGELYPGGISAPGAVEPVELSVAGCRLMELAPASSLEDQEVLDYLVGDLGELGRRLGGNARFVFLIDHPESAAQGWIEALFRQLCYLLSTDRNELASLGLPVESLGVILASPRSLEEGEPGRRLIEVLEEVSLRPLTWDEVKQLAPEAIRFDTRWIDRIFDAAGGHPWLLQYVLEKFVELCVPEPREDRRRQQFDSIVGTLFQNAPSRVRILREWLAALPDGGSQVLAHLLLADGAAVGAESLRGRPEIGASALTERLQRLKELGILYQPEFHRQEYKVGGIFRTWFLHHTGGEVLLEEIQRLKHKAAEATSSEGARHPFYLLVTLRSNLIVADGLFAQLTRPGDSLAESVESLSRRTAKASTRADLNDMSRDLKKWLQQAAWVDGWNKYEEAMRSRGGEASFVLRVEDAELLDSPIEFLQIGGSFLGLKVPTYHQLLGIRREPTYSLEPGWLPEGDQELNALLVASSASGEYASTSYTKLPLVHQEVEEVAEKLGKAGERIRLGRVVVLTNEPSGLPPWVERHPCTPAELERALRGELGCKFHLLHYSGHYLAGKREDDCGMLLTGRRGLELYTLARFEQSLQHRPPRLAVLSACRSGHHGNGSAAYYLGAGYTALRAGARVVIAMRWPIADADARRTSGFLYEALLDGQTSRPEVALWRARQEIESGRDSGILWAAPVMLTC